MKWYTKQLTKMRLTLKVKTKNENPRTTPEQIDGDGRPADPDNTATHTQEDQNICWTVVQSSRNMKRARNSEGSNNEADEIMTDTTVPRENNDHTRQSKGRAKGQVNSTRKIT